MRTPAAMRPANRGRRPLSAIVALAAAFVGSGCGGQYMNPDLIGDLDADLKFYAATAVTVNPGAALIRRGETTSAIVTVSDRSFPGPSVTAVNPGSAGVGIEIVPLSDASAPRACSAAEVPAGEDPATLYCRDWRIVVSADASVTGVGRIPVSAQWRGQGGTIERVGFFDVNLTGLPVTPDVDLVVGGVDSPKVYATQGVVAVRMVRSNLPDPVTLAFDPKASGMTGSFTPNPTTAEYSQLRLDLPARYASGGMVPLRVVGTAGGIVRSKDFVQRVEPLYTVAAAYNGATSAVLNNSTPIDVDVTLTFDPYSPFGLRGAGRIVLSTPNLPRGVTAQFLPDALPLAGPDTTTLRRTLRLSTDGTLNGSDVLQVRATGMDFPADLAGDQPFVDAPLVLELTGGLFWEYVNSGASLFGFDADTVGIALQTRNGQPAIAWLENFGGSRYLALKRYDGITWSSWPAPGIAGALGVPSSRIDEAAFALTPADVGKVAYTHSAGQFLEIATADTSWSTRLELLVNPGQKIRAPRIVTNAADALALSYVVEADPPATSSALFVRGARPGASRIDLPGPQPDGSINRAADGRVLPASTALAVLADGRPVAAWIEQPADGSPAELFVRVHDGAAWGNVSFAPRVGLLVAAPVQLVVERSGLIAVSWLERTDRLRVARLDTASFNWTRVDGSNGDGSLNVSLVEPATDSSLAVDASGRLVVAWVEGGLAPRLWSKRLNAAGVWELLGRPLEDTQATRHPRLVSDANDRLYVAYSRVISGDFSAPSPRADIFVARWRNP